MGEKEKNQDSLNLAGKIYDVKDYQQKDDVSAGLAKTHEQVSDTFMAGEIGAVIDNVAGEEGKIRRDGLEEESK